MLPFWLVEGNPKQVDRRWDTLSISSSILPKERFLLKKRVFKLEGRVKDKLFYIRVVLLFKICHGIVTFADVRMTNNWLLCFLKLNSLLFIFSLYIIVYLIK